MSSAPSLIAGVGGEQSQAQRDRPHARPRVEKPVDRARTGRTQVMSVIDVGPAPWAIELRPMAMSRAERWILARSRIFTSNGAHSRCPSTRGARLRAPEATE